VIHGDAQETAASKNGKVLIGVQKLDPAPSPAGSGFTWTDLSTHPGFPGGACGVADVVHGKDLIIKMITSTGDVWETSCGINGAGDLDCNQRTGGAANPWVKVATQPAPASARAVLSALHRHSVAHAARSTKVSWEPYVRRRA
jgi:hypothetical protein